MSTVAQSPSHRSEIAELFIRDAATLMLPVHSSWFGNTLRSRYDLALINALPRRLCYLGIFNIGASATLLASWPTPGLVQLSY